MKTNLLQATRDFVDVCDPQGFMSQVSSFITGSQPECEIIESL